MSKIVQGVYAAVLTPRTEDGRLDEGAFRRWLDFLEKAGVGGVALNGATGEYPLTTEEELRRLTELASEVLGGRLPFVTGIGAPSVDRAIQLGKIAMQAGSNALLLPMPYFYPYSQEDLMGFARGVAAALDVPILLYNLPQFTSGLAPESSCALIRECDNIVGIKDSSGSLDTLTLLLERLPDACRIVGSDDVLAPALQRGLIDGVVSGVACVLPELLVRMFAAGYRATDTAALASLSSQMTEVLKELGPLPVPWGLKMMAEARGLARAWFPLPLSPGRQESRREIAEFVNRRLSTLAKTM